MREAAVRFAAMGIPAIPLWGITEDGACSCSQGHECKSAGKHPRWPGWQKAAANTAAADGYFAFFGRSDTPANIGLRLMACGLAVIDVDSEEGAELLEDLVGDEDLAAFPAAETSRGVHYFVRTALRPGLIGPGLELKSENVVAPPSMNPDGSTRQWVPGRELLSIAQVPQIPDAVADRLTARAAFSDTPRRGRSSAGAASVSLFSNETIARMLLDRGVSEALVTKHLLGGS